MLAGELGEAQRALDEAARADPEKLAGIARTVYGNSAQAEEPLDARSLYVLERYARLERCDWTGREEFLERFTELARSAESPLTDRTLAFRAMALDLPLDAQLRLAQGIARRVEARARRLRPEPFAARPKHGSRLRIGYVSPEFHHSSLVHNTRRLYAAHDREGFEIFGYALTPDEGSGAREAVREGCDAFRDVSALGDREAAEAIHADAIDVLVDMAGYEGGARPEVLAMRPAPVHASYLAYLGTSGGAWIDYLLTDRVVVPAELAHHYSEAPAYLPSTLFVYDDRQPVDGSPQTRLSWGLPARGPVLGAFHPGHKIDPAVFACWMRLLSRTEGAVLWLVRGAEPLQRNLRLAAQGHGVDPARLVFAPRVSPALNLARLRLCDLCLDTPQYNGGTTGLDALYAGVPVLTCPGRSPTARMGASLVAAAGIPELAVDDLAAYEEKGLALLQDFSKLKALAGRIDRGLFDTRRRARELEEAFREVWERGPLRPSRGAR